jgi:hypothetical protein
MQGCEVRIALRISAPFVDGCVAMRHFFRNRMRRASP